MDAPFRIFSNSSFPKDRSSKYRILSVRQSEPDCDSSNMTILPFGEYVILTTAKVAFSDNVFGSSIKVSSVVSFDLR